MECSSSSKKQRLELHKTDIEKSVLSKKASEVDNTSSMNSSSPVSLVEQNSSHSNNTFTEYDRSLFNRYLGETNKNKPKSVASKEMRPAEFHKWGLHYKIKEKSFTLRELINAGSTIENIQNCKEKFIQMLQELQFDYSIVQLKSLKPEKSKYIFVFDIKSIPQYSFIGCGATEDIAIKQAAKKGLQFFVESCQ